MSHYASDVMECLVLQQLERVNDSLLQANCSSIQSLHPNSYGLERVCTPFFMEALSLSLGRGGRLGFEIS